MSAPTTAALFPRTVDFGGDAVTVGSLAGFLGALRVSDPETQRLVLGLTQGRKPLSLDWAYEANPRGYWWLGRPLSFEEVEDLIFGVLRELCSSPVFRRFFNESTEGDMHRLLKVMGVHPGWRYTIVQQVRMKRAQRRVRRP